MAIAFDATASGGLGVGITKLSWNHTLAAGALLVVGCFDESTEHITSVVWDAAGVNQSLTKVGSALAPGDRYASLWVLANPSATGTKQIDVNADTSIAMRGDSSSYTGCSTTQPDSFGTNTGSSVNPFSVSTTVVASNCWLVGVIKASGGGSLTSSGIMRQSGNGLYYFDSNGTVSTGSQSGQVTEGGADNWGGVIMSLAPASGGGGSAPRGSSRMLSGMGR